MESLTDAIVVVGLTSAALLWVFCIAASTHVLWDTFGEHVKGIIERIKGRE